MKHNLLKSLIISVILLTGVCNVWGGNNIAFQSGAFFYFDPYYSTTQTVDKGYIQLAARKYQNSGHDDYGWYTAVTTLTKIANTRLYYTSTFEGPAWGDIDLKFHGWAMISNSAAKGNGDTEYWTGINSTWYSEFKNYGLNTNSTYLFVATSASNGQSIQPNGTGYLSDGYSALNSQQTIKSAVNGADANSKATISITSYKMTGNGQVTQQTATLGTGANVSYITAARTATTTLTVGTIATGYQFDGWYTEATGGSQLSPSTTYTYYPTAATTVYARFSEKKHNVTVQYKCGDMTLKNNTTLNNVGEITTSNASNAFITGFTFSGWTLGTGVTTSNSLTSESININTLSSGNYTLTANYTENSFAIRGGGQFGNTWDVSRPMTKQNASERIVYCTIPINGTNTGDAPTNQAFYFKVYDATKGQWYGLQAQDFTAYYYNRNAGELGLDGAYDAENIELRADVIGNYIFKIDYSDPERTPKITVTYPDGCFLSGDFNNWKDTHSLLEGPVTIPLTKGDHQFKVHRYDSDKANDYWCGNTGTMKRDGESVQSGGWDMTEGFDNCTLTADIPGDYTFTYDRSSGKMTVSYPEKHTVTLEGSSYGTFVVKCDNYQQTSSTSNITLDVPAGATITIKDIEPHNEGYDQTMVYSLDAGANYTYFSDSTEIDGNRTYTYIVNSDVTIAEDFRTTEDRDIYLKVTAKPYEYWCNNSNDKEDAPGIVYVHELNQNEKLNHPLTYRKKFDLSEETNSYNIYKVTIPKGNNSFCIYPSKNHTDATKQSKIFRIPIASSTISCYELYNEVVTIENNIPSTNGQWRDEITVTIKKVADHYDSDGYGHITVQYNNTKYTSKSNEDVTFKTPIGSTITIVESQHEHPETYNGDLRYTDGGYAQYLNDPVNHPISAWGDIEIEENFVVRKEAVEKKNLQVYLKIPKNDLLNKWKEKDNEVETGDDVRPGYAGNKFANFIWLGIDVKQGQSITGSTEDERGCPKRDPNDPKTQPEGSFLMYPVNIADDNYEIYYCTITDYDWHTIKFERKHEDSDPNVAQLTCADVQRFPGGKNNCFTITGRKNDGAFIGEWGPAPQCQVEMGYTNIGRYGIKDYTGEIHYATPGGTNTTFYVPYGSRVEVLEGEPRSDVYNGMVGQFNGNTVVNLFHDGQNTDNIVTITGYTMFDDLFISKASHEVYLGVPNEGFDEWYIDNIDKVQVLEIKPRDYLPNSLLDQDEKFVIDNITYYKFTLSKGIFKFKFQGMKTDGTIFRTSRDFAYQIPVTEYNCFMLDGSKNVNNEYDGYWTKVPKPNVGDYRVLYAEKELIKTREEEESEDWETAFRTVYEHPSDTIPNGVASKTISLHINTSQKRGDKTVHPMVILQQFQQMEGSNTYKWVNLQAHTVLPLKATGNMAMLPGRKKAYGDLPFYSDGIENIKNDTTYQSRKNGLYKGSGVWNFTVTQGVSQSGTGTTVTLNVGNTTRYTGKYYIRTEALTNGWNNYKDNLMTYSDYADYNSGFSHYFCKWLLVGNNVKFTIANDYAQSISDPLYEDVTDLWGNSIAPMVENDQVLNEDANVRFAWYEMNNFVHRAYLGGSTHVKDRFLVVEGQQGKIFSHYVGEGLPAQGTALLAGQDNGSDPRFGLYADEEIFRDDANWIYHADVQILPGCSATITAKHYGKEQYFIKDAPLVHGYDPAKAKNKYPIRLLYDFKINRLITGYIPNGNNNTDIEPFTTNLMLIRKHHEPATQLLFNSNAKTTQGAYGVMTFERDFLRNNLKTNKERAAYFISFPFDVKISDVFGFGQFYKHWFIQYYDGAARAQNGLWADTDTYWKHITDPNTVLKAYQGYALLFSLSNIEKSGVLDASKEISLYFPSTNNKIGNIKDVNTVTSVEVPAHVCTIERENRKTKDSNWNLIGVPAYADVSGFENNTYKDPYQRDAYFYWKRDVAEDTYEVWTADDPLTFQTMHAYMLQYAGVINWKLHTMDPQDYPTQIIARKNTEENTSHTLRITLNQADKKLDQTYVRLQEEDATADFDMNKDQYKIKKAKANIYSLIQNAVGQIEAGANVLPLQTTIVPLGVIIKTAGEYTFSMPDGTDGIIAELIDYQTNTRTNLALDNYTVNLPAGTNNTRFAISLQPDKTITGLEDEHLSTDGSQVKKFLIDGVLYMQKDGALYDAQGRCVQ